VSPTDLFGAVAMLPLAYYLLSVFPARSLRLEWGEESSSPSPPYKQLQHQRTDLQGVNASAKWRIY
jgi:hypothetical protein